MIISEIEEKDGVIEQKNYRRYSYCIQKRTLKRSKLAGRDSDATYYCLVRYTSIGTPEFLEDYLNLEEAKEAFKTIHKKLGSHHDYK